MKETSLALRGEQGILTDQRTVTGGVRTYGSYTRFLRDGKQLGKNIYQFVIDIPYESPEHVEGVLTSAVAEWEVKDATEAFGIGCYTQKITFKPGRALIDVLVVEKNANIIALTIEGRIVDKQDLTL